MNIEIKHRHIQENSASEMKIIENMNTGITHINTSEIYTKRHTTLKSMLSRIKEIKVVNEVSKNL